MFQSLSITSSQDVIVFCQKRLDKKAANEIIQKGKGLTDLTSIDEALGRVDYISVLKAVWSERDRPKRLDWLRTKVSELHAPLMYELAMAEFTANPSAEVINKICMPLIKAASFRAEQDRKCVDDMTLNEAYTVLDNTYYMALNQLVQSKLGKSLKDVLDKDEHQLHADCVAKVKEVAAKSLTIKLNSPIWFAYHGMNAYSNIKLHPEESWNQIRSDFANDVISKL